MLVRLICWNEDLARERVDFLKPAGWKVEAARLSTSGIIGQFKKLAPDAVLIDLDRLPSHGHAVANVLRQSPTTRRIPIIFAGGAPEKLDRIRKEMPDTVFTEWKDVVRTVKKAVANPLANPARPVSHMQRYAGSPLVTKLELKPDTTVALIAAPEGFEELVGEWPEDVRIEPRFTRSTDNAIWFVRSARDLDSVAVLLSANFRKGLTAWICYPKTSGRYKVDFNLNTIRATCIEVGLIDCKICSIDNDWSGMKITRKKR